MPSYTRPANIVPEQIQVPRPLVPVDPPETQRTVPRGLALPGSIVVTGYLRTSHVLPAALCRSLTQDSTLRRRANGGDAFDVEELRNTIVETKTSYDTEAMQAKCVGKSQVPQWNYVDCYVRQNPPVDPTKLGLTLFLTHATGSHRQTWEPTISHLISHWHALSLGSTVVTDEIWSLESVQHGDSGVLNDEAQKDIFDWRDHTRNVINFLTYYLPLLPNIGALPAILEPVQVGGNTPRQVVGIGHSFGGTVLARAAMEKPGLFKHLILVEPMIVPLSFTKGIGLEMLMRGSLAKPSSWPSREAAKSSFLKSRPMKSWDRAVLDVFVGHALAEDTLPNNHGNETSVVRLKTRPFDEAVVYSEWSMCYEVWGALPSLDPRLHLHWIMSGKSSLTTGGDTMTQGTVWRRGRNTTNVRLPNAGHLIVQESPKDLASEIFAFLSEYHPQDKVTISARL